MIIFIPIEKGSLLQYHEENPEYRLAAEKCFKKIYRDEVLDVFLRFNHPKIIEVTGDRSR